MRVASGETATRAADTPAGPTVREIGTKSVRVTTPELAVGVVSGVSAVLERPECAFDLALPLLPRRRSATVVMELA